MPFLADAAKRWGDAPALRTGEGAVSFLQLSRRAEKVARQLVTLGMKPGDVVALKDNPDSDFIAALHGIWTARCRVAPLNTRWTAQEEAQALEILHPSLVLVGKGSSILADGPAEVKVFSIGDQEERGLMEPLESLWPDTGALPDLSGPESWDPLPAVILLTSGTTGTPGAVSLTFGNLRASALGSMERLGLGTSDTWLASLSPSHVGGLALLSRATILGSTLLLEGPFQAESFASLVAAGSVSHASLVPTMLHQFLEVWGETLCPDSLRCLLIGGAKAPAGLLERALELGFPLALTYGLTEASSQVATAPPELVKKKPGTVGYPLAGVEVRLSQDGEILVRGPTVASGLAKEDGWLPTGDLARLDQDGHLWIVGRLAHRIISGGVNVDPAEVEAVLRTHPGIQEAVVVGIPDPEWGEKVVTAVVPRDGVSLKSEELNRLARAALSPAKRPRSILAVKALPRNPNGKVDRNRVRALFS
jgi:O-succinylbenzoic acid--CoA ligase